MSAKPDLDLSVYGVDPREVAHRNCDACGSLPNRHPIRHLEVADQPACVDVAIADLLALL